MLKRSPSVLLKVGYFGAQSRPCPVFSHYDKGNYSRHKKQTNNRPLGGADIQTDRIKENRDNKEKVPENPVKPRCVQNDDVGIGLRATRQSVIDINSQETHDCVVEI